MFCPIGKYLVTEILNKKGHMCKARAAQQLLVTVWMVDVKPSGNLSVFHEENRCK